MAKQLLSSNFQIAAVVAVALIGLSLLTTTTGFGIGHDPLANRGISSIPTFETTGSGVCTTDDSGDNIFVSGSCTDAVGSSKEVCLGNTIEESYCKSNSCLINYINCPFGYACRNGACV